MAQVLQTQLLRFRHRIGVRQVQVVVWIIAAQGSHGQDLPGIHIHHQSEGPILHIITGDGCLHLVFQAGLHRGVQRQDQTVPFLGRYIFFIRKGHIHFVIALGGDNFPGGTFQKTVIGRLHPFRAGVGGIGKTNDLGRQAAIGVVPLGVGLQMDTGDTVFIDIGADPGGSFFADPGRHLFVAHFDVRRLLFNPLGIQIQNLPQFFRNGRNIRLGLLEFMGI